MIGMTAVAQLCAVEKRRGAHQALAGVDLSLFPGQVLALLGRNGAGKSTAVEILLGLLPADRGRVAWFGSAGLPRGKRQRIGVMLQTAALPATSTVEEVLEAALACYPQPMTLAECLHLAGLQGLEGRRYGRLSGGQQRRVQFALAIGGKPELLFLDEPTTGLDIEARQRLWQTIRQLRQQGAAILLTTHYLEEAEALADHVVLIEQGRVIASGSVAAMSAKVRQQQIRCRSGLDPHIAAAWPGVLSARREGDWLQLQVSDAAALLPRLLAADPALSAIEIRRAGLAEAFLALTEADKEAAR